MEQIIIEIRAAEGGQDSKLLVEDLQNIYIKSAKSNNFNYKVTDTRPGFVSIWLTGKGVKSHFRNESGSHRWLRVPPTEKRGRTQTSIITVAITNPSEKVDFQLDPNDVDIQYTRGQGNGGQHRNKVETCVIITHIPTGIQFKVQDDRSRFKNEEIAWKRLRDRLSTSAQEKFDKSESEKRYIQIGDGDRSNKKRTYRLKEDCVTDHITGKSCTFREFSKGRLELLS